MIAPLQEKKEPEKKDAAPPQNPPPLGKLSWGGMERSGGLSPKLADEFGKYEKEAGNLLKDPALMKLYELAASSAGRYALIKEGQDKAVEKHKQFVEKELAATPQDKRKEMLDQFKERTDETVKLYKRFGDETFGALKDAFEEKVKEKGVTTPEGKALAFTDFVERAQQELAKRHAEQQKKDKPAEPGKNVPKKEEKSPGAFHFAEVPDSVLAANFSPSAAGSLPKVKIGAVKS